jgi:hypothetical protein
MKNPLHSLLLVAACLPAASSVALLAQTPSPAPEAAARLKVLAIGKITATPAVAEAAARKKVSMGRVTQSLDTQLADRVHNTRRFEVVSRSDSAHLAEEAAAAGRAFAFGDADYLLTVTVDDFQDVMETGDFGWAGKVTKRVVRLSAVGKIHDAKTNKLVETANFQEVKNFVEEKQAQVVEDGDLSDSLLVEMSRGMAEKIANKVVDVVYPARVIGVTGPQVTIARGEGSGIATGQLWEIFALGEKLVDPDTGAELGAEEISVGKVRITRVAPKFSTGRIEGENLGIAKLAIARRVDPPAAAPSQP